MGTRPHRAARLIGVGIVSVLLGLLSGGCSSPPPLPEEELLKLLGEIPRLGEHQFRQNICVLPVSEVDFRPAPLF
jgi:hypothetical protein